MSEKLDEDYDFPVSNVLNQLTNKQIVVLEELLTTGTVDEYKEEVTKNKRVVEEILARVIDSSGLEKDQENFDKAILDGLELYDY